MQDLSPAERFAPRFYCQDSHGYDIPDSRHVPGDGCPGERTGDIHLKVIGEQWHADFRGAHDRSEILRLFGTAVLPTPYSASVPAETVRAELQALNPRDRVVTS